ncbi:hypothetical protein IU498_05805 [Nocardia beijingensis]|uniref:RskA family anti-sigma factor n=1 Tax=Nocardia beijingensis TaxID=95162 RepID=UPI001895942F|nr:hypothetical protein [Nocardia beijingensis]MBF6074144.1 hypothetical protein [Nocardia beijingensis]
MTGTQPCRADLVDLAYPYAMDAVAEIERRRIENRLDTADSGTAAAFTAVVRRIRETLAALSATAAVNPPPTLEWKILRAIDDSASEPRRGRGGPSERSGLRRLARVAIGAVRLPRWWPSGSRPLRRLRSAGPWVDRARDPG